MTAANETQNSGTPAASGGNAAGGTPAANAGAGNAGSGAEGAKPKVSLIEDAANAGDAGKGVKDGKAEGEQGQKGAADKAGADGELVLKLPEGVKAPKEYVEQFTAALKGVKGVTPELGSELMRLDLARQNEAADNAVKSWEAINTAWENEIKNDKEFGGDKLPETKANLARALSKFPEGRQVAKDLVEHGVQNLPSLVRLIARYGAAGKEDNSGGNKGGGNPADAQMSRDEKLARRYNKSNAKK